MIDGFFVIDKPAGITSHDVVSRVRRILGTRKVGHTGTLDPFATGVLPVAVNEGTKAIPFLDEGVKCYQARLKLGVATDTLDITGKTLNTADYSHIDLKLFTSVLLEFTGHIEQIPPMFSAIKLDGQPLYKLARQGQEVERKARQVEIRTLAVTLFEPPFIDLLIDCSRGTYIRSLADDIGKRLGCGATLQELRRSVSGPFDISAAISLDELQAFNQQGTLDAVRMTPYQALNHLVDIPLAEAGMTKIRFGKSPDWQDTQLEQQIDSVLPIFARLSYCGKLVAIAQVIATVDGRSKITLKRVFVSV